VAKVAGEPPEQPSRGTSGTARRGASDKWASEDRQTSGGSEPPTSWSPRQETHAGFAVWNYTNDSGSVDCNIGICWDIHPPSRGIFVIMLGRFPCPI
jgi:hypothetical protein